MENPVTYRVRIYTPNCFFIFRGKKIRTPVVCNNVFEHELDVIKMQMLKDSLKYDIVKESEIEVENYKPLTHKKADIKIEELYDPDLDSDSIMDQLIAEEKADEK